VISKEEEEEKRKPHSRHQTKDWMEDQRQPLFDHPDLRRPWPQITEVDKLRRDEFPVDLVLLADYFPFEAVLRHMKPLPGQTSILAMKEDQFYYSYVGVFGVYRVALVFEVSTIKYWSPKAVIVIGTTLGMIRNQQQVGDVIISHSLATFISSGDVMTPSKSIEPSSMFLWNQFAESETKDWKFGSAKVHRGQLVSDIRDIRDPGKLLSGDITEVERMKEGLHRLYPNAIGRDFSYKYYISSLEGILQTINHFIFIKGIEGFLEPVGDQNTLNIENEIARAAAASLIHYILSIDCLSEIGCQAIKSDQSNSFTFLSPEPS